MDRQSSDELKRTLKPIVSLSTRLATKFDGVNEAPEAFALTIGHEHEHEHEHE